MDPGRLPYTLRICAIGPREPLDTAALEDGVTVLLRYIAATLSHPNTSLEWRAVSTLGWPVERLVARRLIELSKPPAIVTVPVPRTAKELSRGYHQLAAYNRDLPKAVARSQREALRKLGDTLRAPAVGLGGRPALAPGVCGAGDNGIGEPRVVDPA